jgi:hypothetical protein
MTHPQSVAESRTTKGCRKNGEKRAARTEKRQASAAAGSAAAGSVHGRQAVHVRQAVHGRQAAAGRQDCRQPAGTCASKNMQLAMLPISR